VSADGNGDEARPVVNPALTVCLIDDCRGGHSLSIRSQELWSQPARGRALGIELLLYDPDGILRRRGCREAAAG
jgi:hypothetical protein